MICNPNTNMQHTWSSIETPYGKIALVLFYSLVWIGIFSNLWSLLFPMSQPGGADCILNVYETDDQKTGIIVFIRLINLLSVGFFA